MQKLYFIVMKNHLCGSLISNIGLFVYNANEAKFPLLASKERTLFKLFLCDVGLLLHKLCKDNVIKILNGDVNFNFGALYELAVAKRT